MPIAGVVSFISFCFISDLPQKLTRDQTKLQLPCPIPLGELNFLLLILNSPPAQGMKQQDLELSMVKNVPTSTCGLSCGNVSSIKAPCLGQLLWKLFPVLPVLAPSNKPFSLSVVFIGFALC